MLGTAADPAAGNAALLAACPHFGACGGCLDVLPKHDVLPRALAAAGFAHAPVTPMAVSPPFSRRRMDLAARRMASGVILGLHRHRSHDIVDLHECRVLHPDLAALFTPLRDLLGRLNLFRGAGSVIGNRLDDGVDLLLRSDAAASSNDRTRLADFARAHGIVRICHVNGAAPPETLAELRRPRIRLSGVDAQPPPGGFLQATAEGEAAIVAAVIAGIPAKPRPLRIAELYAGSGTLTYALAQHARVDAYEGDAASHAALDAACRAAGLTGRVTAILRDLVRQPLAGKDLAPYGCVVLDPPAAGASVQIKLITRSAIARVIYVSCDPHSLSRDALLLRAAGYELIAARPIDQFIGTPRVESVCVFDRPRRRSG